MKRPIFLLLIFCILLLPACSEEVALEIPEHTEQFYVNDYADVLDFETESTIVKYGRQLEELTGAQLVVLTIKSLDGRPLEEYSKGSCAAGASAKKRRIMECSSSWQ